MLFRLKPLYDLGTSDGKTVQSEGLELGQNKDENKEIGIAGVATMGY